MNRPAPALLAAVAVLAGGCSTAPVSTPVAASQVICGGPGAVAVRNAGELAAALADATAGTVVMMAPGTYSGQFTAVASGTAERPVTLCGGRDAVIDGGDIGTGYALHLDGASYWRLSGFSVRGGQKGVVIDAGQYDLVQGLLVEQVGDEAVHLRKASSDDTVSDNEIHDTGLLDAKFGEGVYVGSAQSNWCELSDCGPDRSDRNLVEGNTISRTTAESVDIKEGTSAGTVRGNSFSGVGMSAADAWVNVKGNGWTIADSPRDGFQLHQILDGWGLDNTFSGNKATVNGDGYAINITRNRDRNTVTCTNIGIGAAKGLSTVTCV